MERSETRQLVEAAHEAKRLGQRVALATVVRVRGNAYRRAGASMLVREDGAQACMLSGGCLEPEVVESALDVIASGERSLRHYDLSEDTLWSLGIGCGGNVDILVERVTGDDVLEAWLSVLERGESAVLVTPLTGAQGHLLVSSSGPPLGMLTRRGDVALGLMEAATRHARSLLAQAEAYSGAATVSAEEFGEADLFFGVHQQSAKLVLFGAGHDAIPLARLGDEFGYDVHVVDAREAYLTRGRFPAATRHLLAPEEFEDAVTSGALTFDARTSAVVMNHHLARDRETLRVLLTLPAGYVGVLGPRTRFERMLDELRSEGFTPTSEALARTRSPVGLHVGAETPEEVALSVVAELMALRRGYEGGFLSGHAGKIHALPETSSVT
ncbi:XdhC family protein [Deinococcus yavapaiensis]|uniref:XdhC/CoxI family protein n=1 Tax=Deinococcus yavapaiensis KR-236 TaxID=694435 RepID=A0A318SAC6_9DEIO|nr:XdhC/CoxI family protein [Deinococcus yavapaiensis]PYE55829.1 XdhC/CoxI family protein [Deinococcus yavapaiensis KR-236]